MDETALLQGLLEQFSPTGQESGAVNYLVEQMTTLGFDAQVDAAGNAMGVIGNGPREILMLGHIDTVPGEIRVRQEGDLLYGRGAVDAKGPLACFTAAAARVGVRSGWRICVIGAVGEEGDSRGARSLISRTPPNHLIIGEPSGWNRITLGYKGSIWFNYTLVKPLAHTAAQSESACEEAVGFWNRVTAWANSYNAGRDRVFQQVSPTLRGMESSEDGFQETVRLRIGFRLPLEVSPTMLTEQLSTLSGLGSLSMLDSTPAYRADKNTTLVRAFLSSIRASAGTPTFALKTGTSDMNLTAPVWNCPALAYGPGDSDLDHTPNEHISLHEYLQGVDVLTRVLETLTESGKP